MISGLDTGVWCVEAIVYRIVLHEYTGAGVIAILLLPFIYTLPKHQVIMSGNVPKSQVEILACV